MNESPLGAAAGPFARCRRAGLFPFLVLALLAPWLRAAELPELWAERVKSVVAVEFYIETETARLPALSYGIVVDNQGLVILPASAIDAEVAPEQLKDFKVHRPGNAASVPGQYLGQQPATGWHFLRVEEKGRAGLVPITAFLAKEPMAAQPAIAEEVWGIGVREKDEDFLPYFMLARVAMIQSLPQRTAIALHELATPGLPVFNRAGEFLGLAKSAFGQSFVQLSRSGRPAERVVLINVEESSVFELASEVLPFFGRVPGSPSGRPIAWLGTAGLEPLDPQVAEFKKLDDRGAVLVSEVEEGSPAEKAGLKARDIVVAIDGQPLPRLRPAVVTIEYVDRQIRRRAPGDRVALSILRNDVPMEITAVLGDEPKLVREAGRKYFDRVGLTVREFVHADAMDLRVKAGEGGGVVAGFIKPNSPASTADLRPGDWIREIDGVEVKTLAAALERLAAIESDRQRAEFVVLAARGGETTVLRVKLK